MTIFYDHNLTMHKEAYDRAVEMGKAQAKFRTGFIVEFENKKRYIWYSNGSIFYMHKARRIQLIAHDRHIIMYFLMSFGKWVPWVDKFLSIPEVDTFICQSLRLKNKEFVDVSVLFDKEAKQHNLPSADSDYTPSNIIDSHVTRKNISLQPHDGSSSRKSLTKTMMRGSFNDLKEYRVDTASKASRVQVLRQEIFSMDKEF
jgi:hypothetical protein